MAYDVKLFPERLKKARLARKMTQFQLAVAAGISSQGLITQYERGKFDPGAKRIVQLAVALEVTPGWLLGYVKEGRDE